MHICMNWKSVTFDWNHARAFLVTAEEGTLSAAAKALGTGIGRGVSWHHMHITHDEMGAPLLILSGAAAQRQAHLGSQAAHISIADELDQALAFVVLS